MPVSLSNYERALWELNTHLAVIRFSFREMEHSSDSKGRFLEERSRQIRAGWTIVGKAGLGHFAESVAPIRAQKEIDWLQANIHGVIDHSDHRLNKMELVLRYAFFESVLTDVVGNILWENPDLIKDEVHNSFDGVPKKTDPSKDATEEDFRIRRTEKLVEKIGKLPYKPNSNRQPEKRPACFCDYLDKGLGLEFDQKTFAEILDVVRALRNNIAHRAVVSALKLTSDFMQEARIAMEEFGRRLIQDAMQMYPNACVSKHSDNDRERPGYVYAKILNNF